MVIDKKELLEHAKLLLEHLGMPEKQKSLIACLTIIALADMADKSSWEEASNNWIGCKEVIVYLREHGLKDYAENTRESIRKTAMKPFRDYAIVEDNGRPSNSGNYKYRITKETLGLIHTFNTDEWMVALKYYKQYNNALTGSYAAKKELQKMPVRVNGKDLRFSPGKHNELQKSVLEVFRPLFAHDTECVYVGDSSDRDMYKNKEILDELGFDITLDVLPDVVLYDKERKWLFFIECVTTVGPFDNKRKRDIEILTQDVDAGNIYVTAFLDFKTYKKFSQDLAWDTEVWIAENPEHLIHLNGDRFLGPRK